MREIKTNDRDRLIKLLKQANTLYLDYLESIDQKGLIDTEGRAKFFCRLPYLKWHYGATV